MPPVLALAPLAGSALGAELLPGLAGLLGGGELLGGAGLFGATLGETLGGVLGGAATGALTNDDPLIGGLTGAVSGLGGPAIASGVTGAVDAGLSALGGTAAEAATAAPTSLIPAAGVGSGTGLTTGAAAPSTLAGGAASIAAPESLASSPTLDGALSAAQPDIAGGAGSSSIGSTLNADANALANAGAGGTSSLAPTTAGGNSFEAMIKDPTWDNIGNFAAKNKDLITGGLSLATSALAGNQSFPGEDQLRAQAKMLTGQANQFMRGELTPGMHAGLRGAAESAKAAVRSMFAQRGMSGSTSEMEALASVEQTAAVKGAEIAQSLIQQGINESQLASNLWRTILAASLQRDNELGSAIGNFASAMAGGQRAA